MAFDSLIAVILTLIVVTHAVQRGGKHQLRRGQKQPKGNSISQHRTLDIAGAHAKAHGGGIGGDQTQTPPRGHKAMVLGTLNQPVVELREGGGYSNGMDAPTLNGITCAKVELRINHLN